MCGIVGYVGDRPCRDLLLHGLQMLEYRGYDSAGLSLLVDGRIDSVRAVGHLAELNDAVARRTNGNGREEFQSTTGIAHTRWATHGAVTEDNAHPHFDTKDRVHIVLNGMVEIEPRLQTLLDQRLKQKIGLFDLDAIRRFAEKLGDVRLQPLLFAPRHL